MTELTVRLAKNTHLETERLILRPLTMEDAKSLFEMGSNPRIVKWLTYPLYEDIADAEWSIAEVFMKEPLGKFGIVHKETNHLIGTIDLRFDSLAEAELVYQLNENYQSQGYMTEAVKRVVKLAFEELNIHRVIARCRTDNAASSGVMKEIGMKKEGTLRQQTETEGTFYDMDLYSILKEEFKESL